LTFASLGAVVAGAGLGYLKVLDLTRHERRQLKVDGGLIRLPQPVRRGRVSVEEAIMSRRSHRDFANNSVLLDDISQLCWAAQGVTDLTYGLRTTPSAGALYPVELFLVVGNSDLEAGVYHYVPREHALEVMKIGDFRKQLREASLDQPWIEDGALDLVIAAVYDRTTVKYGERGKLRYVPMEAGHVAENIYLQARSLGLGTVSVGAFDDDRVRDVISAPSEYSPLYLMPIGHART
jgi:SagB-type dehydrogenase family enzyme